MLIYRMRSKILSILLLTLPMVSCKVNKEALSHQRMGDTASLLPANPVPPILEYLDEWTVTPGLSEFRAKLLADLQAWDQTGVLSAFSEKFEINPGTSPGPQGVIETWGLDGTPTKLATLRTLLQSLVENGGCHRINGDDTSFFAPYYACLPESVKQGCGENGCAIADRKGASYFRRPDSSGKPVGKLASNEIISSFTDTLCTEDFSRCDWRKITRADGQILYVPYEGLKNTSDGYLWLVKEEAGWKIRVLRGPGVPYNDN